jgi:hypothetical protein
MDRGLKKFEMNCVVCIPILEIEIVEPIDRCSAVFCDVEISNDRDSRCICEGHIGVDPIREKCQRDLGQVVSGDTKYRGWAL